MLKTKLSPSMQNALYSWEKEINKALETGKGKYVWVLVRDIHDYKKVIKLMMANKMRDAALFVNNLDTASRDEIPDKIYDYLISS